MAEQNYVELRHVNKKYKDFQASDDINFGIGKGKLIGLLGPSGSGKTTILRMLAGLEHADSGEIIIDGRVVNDVPASERGIGFVFQNYALFRYMTVYDNIAFGLDVKKWKKADIRRRVDELVELVGLKGFEKRYPNQLSGGQRQRVAFARALAPNPELLLLDEHTAALDPGTADKVLKLTQEIIEKNHTTCLMVTHNMQQALSMGNRTLMMDDGKIVLDVEGKERENMTVTDLLEKFHTKAGKDLDNDRILLSMEPGMLPEEVLQVFLAVEILRNQKEKNSSRTDEDRAIIGKIP